MMACYMYITIKDMKLKTSVVYVHSVALKVKFKERKGNRGFKMFLSSHQTLQK